MIRPFFPSYQSQKAEFIEITKIPGRKKTFLINCARRRSRIVPIVAKKVLASYLHLANSFVIIFSSSPVPAESVLPSSPMSFISILAIGRPTEPCGKGPSNGRLVAT